MITTQICNYAAPTPTPTPTPTPRPTPTSLVPMPLPAGQFDFVNAGSIFPSMSADPSQAIPIGIGTVALGGDKLSVQISLNKFTGPVDVYFGYWTDAAPDKISVVRSDYTVREFNIDDINRAVFEGAAMPSGREAWKKGTTEPVNEIVLNSLPITDVAAGEWGR